MQAAALGSSIGTAIVGGLLTGLQQKGTFSWVLWHMIVTMATWEVNMKGLELLDQFKIISKQ